MSRSADIETGALPNLIVIGAMKCGTTSLHRNLDLHPEIGMSARKELNFFLRPDWREHLDEYRAMIPAGFPVRGESSPNYTKCRARPGVPPRIAEALPDVRMIYCLRDPVERIVSHWVHVHASGVDRRSLEDALEDLDESNLVDASLYHRQLLAYLEHFDLAQIHVTTMEALSDDPTGTMQAIFRFLGVDDRFDSPDFKQVRHASTRKRRATALGRVARRTLGHYRLNKIRQRARFIDPLLGRDPVPRPELSDALRRRLEDRVRDDVRQLRALTGMAFSGWSV